VIFAFDLAGSLKWKANNGKAWKASFPGARAACAYSQGRLYHMNAHGRVACLDAKTGEELWAVDVLERFQGRNITLGLSECLLVDGQRVIVTPGGNKALMAALDKSTGRTIWTTEPIEGDQATHSSPILFRYAGRRYLANCCSGHGFGVDAETGKLQWKVPLRNQYGVNVTPPVYGSGSIFYVTAYTPAWLYRLHPQQQIIKAEPVWTCSLDTVTGGAILVDGILYASRYSRSKWWFAVDWRTGQTRHELKTLTTGAAVYADGRLYCLAEDGRAALLAASPGGLSMISQFRLVEGRLRDAWAHPVLLGGKLYLRYHDTLWCYDVGGQAPSGSR